MRLPRIRVRLRPWRRPVPECSGFVSRKKNCSLRFKRQNSMPVQAARQAIRTFSCWLLQSNLGGALRILDTRMETRTIAGSLDYLRTDYGGNSNLGMVSWD